MLRSFYGLDFLWSGKKEIVKSLILRGSFHKLLGGKFDGDEVFAG